MTHCLPEPDWAPFAAGIRQRLTRTLDAKSSRYGYETVLIAPEDSAEATPPDGDLLPCEAESDVELDEADPEAEPPPMHVLSAQQLQLTLRLAATLKDPAGVKEALKPGAITLITGMAPSELGTLADLLWLGFLPPGCRIARNPDRPGAKDCNLLLLYPDGDDEFSRPALRSFHEQIGQALAATAPVLILCPDEARPPAALTPYLPTPLDLAPVYRNLMLQHLRLAYPDDARTDPRMLYASLPEDGQLAGLSSLGLQVALRAPDAQTASARLAGFLQPPARDRGEIPRLEDMAGDSEALSAARQLVGDLALWKQGRIAWTELCRSLLLFGQPGTGKTHLARMMGNSAGIAFIATSFADWQANGHLGDMLKAMQKSFAEARRRAPTILFIDEIDAAGSREGGDRHGSSYRMQVINGFLQQMDSISREPGVIVIGACNHPDRIDPAILRAGRFDLKIEVPLPDTTAILGILRHHLDGQFDDEDLRSLAREAVGSSAAEVDAAIRQARATARRHGCTLCLEDIRRHCAGAASGDAAWAHRIAIHECGHAIVAAALGTGTVVRLLMTRTGGTTSRHRKAPLGLLSDIMESRLRAAFFIDFRWQFYVCIAADLAAGSRGRHEIT